MTNNVRQEELVDKIKFEVLVPFATTQDSMHRAELLFEKGVVAKDGYGYPEAVSKIEQLINQQVIQAQDKIMQIIRSTDYTPKSLDESYDRALVELYKKQLIDLIKEYKGKNE